MKRTVLSLTAVLAIVGVLACPVLAADNASLLADAVKLVGPAKDAPKELLLKPGDYEHAIRFAVAASALKHTIPGDFAIIARGEVEALMKGGGLRINR